MSPEPDALPFVSPGMIWDGVTEYQDSRFLPSLRLSGYGFCRMYGDGTRRFSESGASQAVRCHY